jgi:hypothetical protein
MFTFSIAESDGKKYNTLREIFNILIRKYKYVTTKSLYSPEREIFEAYDDIFFIVHDESTNTQEKFSINVYGHVSISDSNDKCVYMYDFFKKYNYPKEIYDKDIKDYEEELQYQVTQLDRQQITSFTVLDNENNIVNEFLTQQALITDIFDNIIDINSINISCSLEVFSLDFKDYKIKINYQDKEIIFTVKMPSEDSPLINLFDSDYENISMEDFLRKFYINETEKYTIEDFIKQKDDFIETLTRHLHELEKIRRGDDGIWGDDGYFDKSFQWNRQICFGPDR